MKRLLLKDFVIFDIETSGFKKECCDILEISALKVINGEIADTFSTLIKPKNRLSPEAMRVNGITYDMVKDAPNIGYALGNFLEFIANNPLFGYNVGFDKGFVNYNLVKLGQKELTNEIIDVLPIAKKLLPHLPNHKQTTIANFFNIKTQGAHRALNDCVMLYYICQKLLAEYQNKQWLMH